MKWPLLLPLFLVACAPALDICTDVNDPYDKDYCLLDAGLEQNVSAACDAISDENLQMWCYTDVANNIGDARVCDDIDKESTREHCIKNVGITTNDEKLCAAIQGTAAGDECYRTLAVNDPSLCIHVLDTDQRNTCYVTVAEANVDYTHCTFIDNDDRRRDACIFRTSLTGNATIGCAETVLEEFTQLCYYNHAIKFLDSTICADIENESVRASCRAAVKAESRKQ